MTEAKTTGRRRRRDSMTEDIPAAVAAWFAGTGSVPWAALLHPELASVPDWWLAWKADHPRAAPPAGAPWITWAAS